MFTIKTFLNGRGWNTWRIISPHGVALGDYYSLEQASHRLDQMRIRETFA